MAANSRGKWLFKEEPSHYSFDALLKDGKTVWDGVENNLALKHLRLVKKGDEIMFYQTGDEKSIVGIMRATSNSYPDPQNRTGKLVLVDVVPVRKLPRPVSLSQIKSDPRFAAFELVRIPRLSVMPVPEEIWDAIVRLSRS